MKKKSAGKSLKYALILVVFIIVGLSNICFVTGETGSLDTTPPSLNLGSVSISGTFVKTSKPLFLECKSECNYKLVSSSKSSSSSSNSPSPSPTPSLSSNPPANFLVQEKIVCSCDYDYSEKISSLIISLNNLENELEYYSSKFIGLSSEKGELFQVNPSQDPIRRREAEVRSIESTLRVLNALFPDDKTKPSTGSIRDSISDVDKLTPEEAKKRAEEIKRQIEKLKEEEEKKQEKMRPPCFPKVIVFNPWEANGTKISLELLPGQRAIVPLRFFNSNHNSRTSFYLDFDAGLLDMLDFNNRQYYAQDSGFARSFGLAPREGMIKYFYINPKIKEGSIKGKISIKAEGYENNNFKKTFRNVLKPTEIEVKIVDNPKNICCPKPNCLSDEVESAGRIDANNPNVFGIWVPKPEKNWWKRLFQTKKKEFYEINLGPITMSSSKDYSAQIYISSSSDNGAKVFIINPKNPFVQKPGEKGKINLKIKGDKEGTVNITFYSRWVDFNSDGSVKAASKWGVYEHIYVIKFKKDILDNCAAEWGFSEKPAPSECLNYETLVNNPSLNIPVTSGTPVPPTIVPAPPTVVPAQPAGSDKQDSKQIKFFKALETIKYYGGGEGSPDDNSLGSWWGIKEVIKVSLYLDYEGFKNALKKTEGKEFYDAVLAIPRRIEITTIYDGISRDRLITSFEDNAKIINDAISGKGQGDEYEEIQAHNQKYLSEISSEDKSVLKESFKKVFTKAGNKYLPVDTKIILELGRCGTRVRVIYPDETIIFDGYITDEDEIAVITKLQNNGILLKDTSKFGLRIENPYKGQNNPENIDCTADRLHRKFNSKSGESAEIEKLKKGENLIEPLPAPESE